MSDERRHAEAVANDFFWKRDLAIAHGTERPELAGLIMRERKEAVREALEEVEEILKSRCADARAAADVAHRKHKYEDESRHEHAGMAIWRTVEAIRAMVPK